MTTEELIKYIYETPLEETVFGDNQNKGERAVILITKYGKGAQKELKQRFGDNVTFNNVSVPTAVEISKQIGIYLSTDPGTDAVNSEPTSEDYANFKKMLEYFVHMLRANCPGHPELLIAGEPKSGQGWKGHKIRNSYAEFNSFSNGRTMDVSITSGFPLFGKNCYINWSGTGINVRSIWNEEKDNVNVLQLYVNVANKWVGGKIPLSDLGLNDTNAPNETVKKFYKDYLALLNDKASTAASINCQNQYSAKVIESRNVIFRGAPGTGKSFLAKAVAADIVSNGAIQDYALLGDEQKRQIEFVQFHPSYDYTDFVEGLRPKINDDGSMGFELQDGIFKKFVAKACKSKSSVVDNFDECWGKLVDILEESYFVEIPHAQGRRSFPIELNEIGTGLATRAYPGAYGDGEWISGKSRFYNKKQLYNVYRGLPGVPAGGHDNYRKAIVQYMKDSLGLEAFSYSEGASTLPYVFIIDEINRGEISKIFGELFFAIDPEYRGKLGEVSTQYSNLHENPDEKFFVPDNVYIIGTMNDIDRSVDSFDFAMRRRFRFIEIKANGRLEMLDGREYKDEAIRRMNSLNEAISNVEELNDNYHIGASYFLKLDSLSFEELWADYLEPLLQEYVRGMYDEQGILIRFKEAFEKAGTPDENNDES